MAQAQSEEARRRSGIRQAALRSLCPQSRLPRGHYRPHPFRGRRMDRRDSLFEQRLLDRSALHLSPGAKRPNSFADLGRRSNPGGRRARGRFRISRFIRLKRTGKEDEQKVTERTEKKLRVRNGHLKKRIRRSWIFFFLFFLCYLCCLLFLTVSA